MDDKENDVVVPVVSEELHAGAVPVVTGGVRVTKRVHTHDEVLEQELRRTHAEVKRVRTNRVVDGPQPVRREGNTLIIPVVSEVLHVEKQWVVTEEIHITQSEETERVRETVPVSREEAQVERMDKSGNPVAAVEPEPASEAPALAAETRTGPASIVERTRAAAAGASGSRRATRSVLTKKTPGS
jgi:stress response protein YsnF